MKLAFGYPQPLSSRNDMTVSLDEFAVWMRKMRIRKAIEACEHGMNVCQQMIDNELANKNACQTRQMLLIKELSDLKENYRQLGMLLIKELSDLEENHGQLDKKLA
jgi:hypothetical protein